MFVDNTTVVNDCLTLPPIADHSPTLLDFHLNFFRPSTASHQTWSWKCADFAGLNRFLWLVNCLLCSQSHSRCFWLGENVASSMKSFIPVRSCFAPRSQDKPWFNSYLSYAMEARCDKTVAQELEGSTQWSKLLPAFRLATLCFKSAWRFRSQAATRALHEDLCNFGRTVWFSTEAIKIMADSFCCGWLGKSHWRWVYHSRLLSRCRQGIWPSGPHPSWTHAVDCWRASQGALLVC